jgi:hypothetical protein
LWQVKIFQPNRFFHPEITNSCGTVLNPLHEADRDTWRSIREKRQRLERTVYQAPEDQALGLVSAMTGSVAHEPKAGFRVKPSLNRSRSGRQLPKVTSSRRFNMR